VTLVALTQEPKVKVRLAMIGKWCGESCPMLGERWYTLDELSPPQYILTKGTRPFSGPSLVDAVQAHGRPIRGLAAWLPEPGTPYWPPSALAHRRP